MSKRNPGTAVFTPILALFAAVSWPAAIPARAQGLVARQAPASPRFRDWVARHMPRGTPGPAGGSREGGMRTRGYIPPPIDLSHIQGPIFSTGPADPAYPPRYDLRATGELTPVKDQGQYGTCWSFACIGSLESSLLKSGRGAFNLSEWHLAYFGYRAQNASLLTAFTPGPLGELEDPVFDQGGNDWISTALLARGTGAVDERDCPYQRGSYRPEPRPAGDLPNGREKLSVPLEQSLYLMNSPPPERRGFLAFQRLRKAVRLCSVLHPLALSDGSIESNLCERCPPSRRCE